MHFYESYFLTFSLVKKKTFLFQTSSDYFHGARIDGSCDNLILKRKR